jgi:PAS domain S-box-containing protein
MNDHDPEDLSGYGEALRALEELARSASPAPGDERPAAGPRPGGPNRPGMSPADQGDVWQGSEETLGALLESLPDALVVVNRRGVIVLVNEQTERLFGYTRAELLGRPIEILVPEGIREEHVGYRDHYFDYPRRRPLESASELHGQRKDGSLFPVEISLSPVQTANGLLVSSIIRDVSRQKRDQAKFRTLIENIPAVTFIAPLDRSDPELYVSPQIEELLGFSQKEWLEDPILWHRQLHPEDRERWNGQFAPSCATAEPFRSVYRFLAKDERTVWVHGSASVVRDDHGSPAFLQGVAFDITAIKEAEAERERFFSLALDLFCVAGFDGFFKRVNPAFTDTLGYTAEELLQQSFLDFVHPDDREATRAAWNRLIRDAVPLRLENRYRCKDGSFKWLQWSATAHRDERVLYATARDVTDRKQHAEALADREERIRLLLDSTGEAIYGLDLDGNCTFCNRACVRLLGYADSSDLLGRDLHRLIRRPQDPALNEEDRLSRACREGEGMNGEDIFRRADGMTFPVEYWAYPVRQDGREIGAVVVFVDLTQRRELEKQFRQAQKMDVIGRLAGGVAHDFNNLLSIINGYSQLLLLRLPPKDDSRPMLQEMLNAGERAAALTRQLLALGRKSQPEPKVLDLRLVVADLERLLLRIIGEDIRLVTKADAEPGLVKVDPTHLEQVILNLVVNARDAMPQGGQLTIEVRKVEPEEGAPSGGTGGRSGPQVLLSVTDTGCGMDGHTLAHLFEPFFTTKGERGTGLGLATVAGIVKQSGGHITVASEPGRGTSFRVFLPRVAEKMSLSGVRSALPALARGTETVLMVEDEPSVRSLIRAVLRECGYSVLEANDGIEAVQLAQQYRRPIDLLIADVVLPRLSGPEVARQVGLAHPEVKVLFLSGYTEDAVVRRGIRQAEVPFLQKPLAPTTLSQKVRQVLNRPRGN